MLNPTAALRFVTLKIHVYKKESVNRSQMEIKQLYWM
jgi:hypothetical protein